jgi:hypothetical protein
MGERDLIVGDDLKDKFHEFLQIAEITGHLQKQFTIINKDNLVAGGTDDEVAKTYHKQIDEPTTFLVNLVTKIQDEFHLTNDKGTATANAFDDANHAADGAAGNW